MTEYEAMVSQSKELAGLQVHRDSNSGFVGFSNIQEHRGFITNYHVLPLASILCLVREIYTDIKSNR